MASALTPAAESILGKIGYTLITCSAPLLRGPADNDLPLSVRDEDWAPELNAPRQGNDAR